jgi:hypothetical protein
MKPVRCLEASPKNTKYIFHSLGLGDGIYTER